MSYESASKVVDDVYSDYSLVDYLQLVFWYALFAAMVFW